MARLNKNLITIVFLVLFVVLFISGGVGNAYAFSSTETGILTDLSKDSSFTMEDYPQRQGDYSLKVFQIAESVDGSLYVYVYQPWDRSDLRATSINMSLNEGATGTRLYTLTHISSYFTVYKFKVDGVKVSSAGTRYYNISSIYRKYDLEIDGKTSTDNTIKEVAYDVGKLFIAETVDETVKYDCRNVDVVEIINPYVDFISYGGSTGWDLIFDVTKWTDIHYIAFSTNKQIETLKEADVTYTTQSYHYTGLNDKGFTYGKKSEPQYITLTGKEEIGIDGFKQYTWNSIYRTEDFIKATELTGAAKTEVEKSEFVLVFLKTSYEEQELWNMMQGHYKEADGTKVSDVSILRLMFETDGICYNLGAIMDKQEGDNIAGNKPESGFGFWAWLAGLLNVPRWAAQVIFWCVIGLIALAIFSPVLSLVFPPVGQFLKRVVDALFTAVGNLFIGVWWFITLPFRGIALLVQKITERREVEPQSKNSKKKQKKKSRRVKSE